MGLDIDCNGVGRRVGSYSSVHIARNALVWSAIYFLENYCEKIESQIKENAEKMEENNIKIKELYEQLEDENIEENKAENIEKSIEIYNVENSELDLNNIIFDAEKYTSMSLITHLKNVCRIGETISTLFPGQIMKYKSHIDYDYLHKNKTEIFSQMRSLSLEGLIYWIDHSDCEGYFTSSQSSSFLHFIKTVIPVSLQYFEKNKNVEGCHTVSIFDYLYNPDTCEDIITLENYKEYTQEEIGTSYYLYDVIRESDESGEPICFC